MNIKKKFKDMWRKVKGEKTAKKTATRRAAVDAEISAEEVTREEIFPSGRQKTTNRPAAVKPASESSCAQSDKNEGSSLVLGVTKTKTLRLRSE